MRGAAASRAHLLRNGAGAARRAAVTSATSTGERRRAGHSGGTGEDSVAPAGRDALGRSGTLCCVRETRREQQRRPSDAGGGAAGPWCAVREHCCSEAEAVVGAESLRPGPMVHDTCDMTREGAIAVVPRW